MEAWQVVLLILMIALFLYIVLLFFVLSHVLEFKSRLRYRLVTLSIVMEEKRRLLKKYKALLEQKGAEFGDEDKAALEKVNSLDLENLKYTNAKDAISTLKSATSRLAYLSQHTQNGEADPEITSFEKQIEENERSIRQGIAGYNMDVVALNYWCAIPLTDWLVFVIGIRKRESLN